MKVRCKKILSPDREKKELDTSRSLTKGKEYIVLGISTSKHENNVYIECDGGGLPGYFDILQFDVVSCYLPSNWEVNYMEKFYSLDFYPKNWIEADNFWARFVDGDDEMVALFEKEKELIYREEAEYEMKQRAK